MSLTVSSVITNSTPIDPVAAPSAQPAEPKASSTTEKTETVAQATLPQEAQRPFSELKTHVWTELKKVLDDCDMQIKSKSYWAIDPRQGMINIAKGVLKRTGEKQAAQFEEPRNPEELCQKLHYVHDHTIPDLLQMFNPLTNFNPLNLVKQTLEAAPQKVSQLIEEVEKDIRIAKAAQEQEQPEVKADSITAPSEKKADTLTEEVEKKSGDTDAPKEREEALTAAEKKE